MFVNFLCFVFEILAVAVCTVSAKSELEANRSDVIDAHWQKYVLFLLLTICTQSSLLWVSPGLVAWEWNQSNGLGNAVTSQVKYSVAAEAVATCSYTLPVLRSCSDYAYCTSCRTILHAQSQWNEGIPAEPVPGRKQVFTTYCLQTRTKSYEQGDSFSYFLLSPRRSFSFLLRVLHGKLIKFLTLK